MLQISLAIIENKEEKKILMQHRDANAPTNPNKWGLWGGTVEGDETPKEAIVRELHEELQLELSPNEIEEFFSYEYEKPDGALRDMHIFYLVHSDNRTYIQCEGDSMKFFTYDELRSCENLCPVTKIALFKHLDSADQ